MNSFLWSLDFSLNGGERPEGGLGNGFAQALLPELGAHASLLYYLASGGLLTNGKCFVIF
jgi:hypothetical protein